jgi:hypothetical protein
VRDLECGIRVEPSPLAKIEYRTKSAEGKVRHPLFNRVREVYERGNFVEPDQADLPDGLSGDFPVQPPLQKYFCSRLTQISSLIRAVLSHMRGVSRSSRTLGTGCGGRGRR